MKALVVKLSALGDIIHAMPAVRRAVMEGVRIGWMVDARYARILELFPGLEAVHIVYPRGWGSALRRGRLAGAARTMSREIAPMRAAGYDAALDIQGLIKSALLSRLAAAGPVTGFSRNVCREKQATWFYNRKVDADPLTPVTQQIMKLLSEALGIPALPAPAGLTVPPEGREAAAGYLTGGRPAVLIAGGGWRTKLIPVPILRQVALDLARRGPVLVLSGSDEERRRAAEVVEGVEAAAVVHRADLLAVAGILEGATVVVGPDTGLVHLAAGLGAPTVSVYGPSLGSRSGPVGERHRHIQSQVHCSPCFKRDCDDIVCMETLDSGSIIRSALEISIDRSITRS